MPEHGEEAESLEEERMELTAAAKKPKIRKELEIFVGGLDCDVVEEDVKKAFEKIGEVVEVRLHKNPSTNKNKSYAFVQFATKEQASRALSEMKNPIIHGKQCGTAPSEDNDSLFLGNIAIHGQRKLVECADGGAGSFSKFGRGFGCGGHAFNWPNFQRGRGVYQHGCGQTWRMGFSSEHDLGNQFPPSHRREMFGRGGRRDSFGGAHDASGGGTVPARPNLDRIRHEATDRGHGRHPSQEATISPPKKDLTGHLLEGTLMTPTVMTTVHMG